MTYSNHIILILEKYKRINPAEKLILIPVLDDNGRTVGFLRPITTDFEKTMPECAEQFGRWRRENPEFSPSRFNITTESTAKWLMQNIVCDKNRILFAIQNLRGKNIGHIGYANFQYPTKTAEVDCVLRGEKKEIPGLMGWVMKALVHWGRVELQLEHIELKVLWDNDHAITFYQKCGFEKRELIPLKKVEIGGDVQWVPYDNAENDAKKYYLHMVLF